MNREYVAQFRMPVHGTGEAEIPVDPSPYPGGIFGQPSMPPGRTGIFRSSWALDPRWTDDAGILAPYTNRVIPGSIMDRGGPTMIDPGGGVLNGVGEWWAEKSQGEKAWYAAAGLLAAILLLRK